MIELPAFVSSASEFLIRMIEEASRTEDSDILFKSLEMPQGAEIVRGVVEVRRLLVLYILFVLFSANMKQCICF